MRTLLERECRSVSNLPDLFRVFSQIKCIPSCMSNEAEDRFDREEDDEFSKHLRKQRTQKTRSVPVANDYFASKYSKHNDKKDACTMKLKDISHGKIEIRAPLSREEVLALRAKRAEDRKRQEVVIRQKMLEIEQQRLLQREVELAWQEKLVQ